MNDPLRVGVAGAGRYAAEVVIPVLQRLGNDVVVVAVGDPDEGRARAVAARFGIAQRHPSVAAMINGSLDAVVLAIPPAAQFDAAMRALRDGHLHVLCGSPMTTSASNAQAIRYVAERRRRRLAVDYPIAALVADAVAQARDGAIGALTGFQASSLRKAEPTADRRSVDPLGGGI